MQSSLEQHLTNIKDKYKDIISFIEKPDFNEEEYDIFMKKMSYQNKNELREYLHLISSISGGHRPTQYFYDKFERILRDLRNDIMQFFSNHEIYSIFDKSIRILYFLIKEKMVIIDQYILTKWISNLNFMIYYAGLAIEAFPSMEEVIGIYVTNFDAYYKYRFNGDSKDSIISIIQKDSINDFISYIKENETDLSSELCFINDFYDMKLNMLNQCPKLIECAAYYGSFQIFQYLIDNGVEVNLKTMHYSIYGQNLDIIHILEKANIKPDKESYEISIQCHHNEIRDYIKNNYFKDDDNIDNDYLISILKYHNYPCIKTDFITESNFFNFCKFDYIYFVEFLLQSEKLNLNSKFEKKTKKDDTEKVTCKTPLYISIKRSNFGITKFLLEQKNIDVNVICSKIERLNGRIVTNEIFTSVNAAIYAQNDDIIEPILKNPNIDVNLRLSKYKYITGINNESHLTDLKNVKEQTNEYSYIIEAVRNNFYKAIQLLLSNPKIDVNVTFHFLFKNENESQIFDLNLLSLTEDVEVAKLLLGHPQVDINGTSIITLYCNSNDNEKCIKNYTETTFLMTKILSKNTELVRFIMSNKDIDCNRKSISKERLNGEFVKELYTPLYMAVNDGLADIVEILLSNPKTDVNAISKRINNNDTSDSKMELTALHCAVETGNIEILKLLLSHHSIDANVLYNNIISRVPNDKELPRSEEESSSEIESSSSEEEDNEKITDEKNKSRKTEIESASEEDSASELCSSSSSEEEDSEKQKDGKNKDNKLENERKAEIDSASEIDSSLNEEKEKQNDGTNKDNNFENERKTEIESASEEDSASELCSSSSSEEDNNKKESDDDDVEKINESKKVFSETKKFTALQLCLDKNNIDLFKLLVSHDGTDLNIRSIYEGKTTTNIKTENTILYAAVEKGSIDFVKHLLTRQEIDVNKKSIETSASPKQTYSALSYIYHMGEKIDTIKKRTPLSIAILKGNKEIIQLLLSNPNIDVNSKWIESTESQSEDTQKEYTPLFYAVNNNDIKSVEELLANPKIDVNILLTELSYKEDVDENQKFLSNLKKLISLANGENNKGEEEEEEEVERRDKKLHDKKQFNVLHFAVENERIPIIKLLLNHATIDVNIKSIHYQKDSDCLLTEQTALHIAIEKGNTEIVQLLLSRKETDVNSIFFSDLRRCTNSLETKKYAPLHLAIDKENPDIVELLINRKDLDVNYLAFLSKGRAEENSDEKSSLEIQNMTALYMAIDKYNSKIVEILLKRDDLDVNIKATGEDFEKPYSGYNGYEKTFSNPPLALAIDNRKVDIIELLLKNPKIDTKAKNIVDFKKYGAEKTKIYERSLFELAIDKPKVLKLLLPYIEFDLNERIDIRGEKTPLNISIQKWNMDLFDYIIQQKDLDVNKISYFESGEFTTPLAMSAFAQNFHAFKGLIKRSDIDINKLSKLQNGNGNFEELTALQVVIEKCLLDYLELILQYQNIDVNLPLTRTTIINGENTLIEKLTPLYVAVEVGDCDKIKLLLNRDDIDIDAVNTIDLKGDVNDHHQLTVLQRAMLSNNAEIINLLKDFKLKSKK